MMSYFSDIVQCPASEWCIRQTSEGQEIHPRGWQPNPSCCQHLLFTLHNLKFAAVFLDVTRNGTLLDLASCAGRYPQLTAHLQQQMQQHTSPLRATSQIGWAPPEEAPADVQQEKPQRPPSVVAVWASLARCMVTAHQRRGESDLVAHWLYQLLALDTQAVEWNHVLQ